MHCVVMVTTSPFHSPVSTFCVPVQLVQLHGCFSMTESHWLVLMISHSVSDDTRTSCAHVDRCDVRVVGRAAAVVKVYTGCGEKVSADASCVDG